MPLWTKITFAVFPICVIALVVYGVTTHTEAGLLTACETLEGGFDYGGDCFDVHLAREQVPIGVSVAYVRSLVGNRNDALENTLGVAMRDFNSMVGCDVFTLDLSKGIPAVWLTFNVLPSQMQERSDNLVPLDGVRHRRVSKRVESQIEVADVPSTLLYSVLVHALGHAAGLAHDDFADSVMFYRADARGAGVVLHRLTDHDQALLARLYCEP